MLKKPLVFLSVTPKKITIAYVSKNMQFVADLRKKYTVSVQKMPTPKITISQKAGGPAVTKTAVTTVFDNVVVPTPPSHASRMIVPIALGVTVGAAGLLTHAVAKPIIQKVSWAIQSKTFNESGTYTLLDRYGPIPVPRFFAVRHKHNRNYVAPTIYLFDELVPEIIPLDVIRNLNEDIFWALVLKYFETALSHSYMMHERDLPSILYLLEMRQIIPSAADVWRTTTISSNNKLDFGGLATGYWRCNLLNDFMNDNKPVFDSGYRMVANSLIITARDIMLNRIDQHRSYQYQFENGHYGLDSQPRPDAPYDGPVYPFLRNEPVDIYFSILCRYLFFIDYIEAPSFLKFLSADDLMRHFPEPTQRKLWLALIRQVCPNCNLLDNIFTDIKFPVNSTGDQANELSFDVKLILLRMGAFKELDLHESTRSALNTQE